VGGREPCSRCLQHLGTGLQLTRLTGTGALTACDGAGDGVAAACGFVPRAVAGGARLRGRPISSVMHASVGRALACLRGAHGVS